MSLAVLVLGAHQPQVLREHLSHLYHPDIYIFVHLDIGVQIESYCADMGSPNVTFISHRHRVYWGGFNMVRAEFSLVEEALKLSHVDRLALISDDSFSLLTPSALIEAADISGLRVGMAEVSSAALAKRYERFFYFDSDLTSARHLRAEDRFIDPVQVETFRRIGSLMESGKKALKSLRHGSQWWIMSRDAASCCLDMYRSDDHLRESFEFSAIPDEQYIQTMLANAGLIADMPSPMYSDFSRNPKPFVFSTIDEVTPALASGALFVRKIAAHSACLRFLRERHT